MTGLYIIFGGMLLFVTIVVAYDPLTRRQHVASANNSADPPDARRTLIHRHEAL